MTHMPWGMVLVVLMLNVSVSMQDARKVIRKKIKEEIMVGTILMDLKKELEFEPNKLKIVSQNPKENPEIFDFDTSTGVLRSSMAVDREKLCPNQPLCTLKYNILRKKPFSVTKLEFEIEDINDNKPTFPKTFMKAIISESTPPGKFFLLHLAEDKDNPEYGIVNYKLDPSKNPENLQKFELKIDKLEGRINDVWLQTKEVLDREDQSTYLLHILAVDGGDKTGSAMVEVTVLNLNDNPPQFLSKNYQISVPENTRSGKELTIITASDPDEPENPQINYSFSDKTKNQFGKYFDINKTSGVITLVKKVDYEKMISYSLEVIAEDQGFESLSSKTTVIINIENVNDNKPKIEFETANKKKEVALLEGVPSKSKVVRFNVSDADDDFDVQCHLSVNQSKENPFSLKKETFNKYLVQTSSSLDRETDQEHLLVITCVDSEPPHHTSHAKFLVHVLDVNDNTPKFSRSLYNISITENNKSHQKMDYNLRAVDNDLGTNGMITYSIHSHNHDPFQIDAKSGEIWTTAPLDREKSSSYRFTIMARDGDKNTKDRKSSTAVVAVSVMDVNDEAPRFKQPVYNFSVTENRHGKHTIGQVHAIDLDLRSRKSFFLDSKNGPSSRYFKIDSKSGELFATRRMDREERSVHTLKVKVKDDQKSYLNDSAIINIHVEDENDNPPVIDVNYNDTVYISQHSRPNELISTIHANDIDAGNNSKLLYTISQATHPNLFRLDPENGNIYLNSNLPKNQNRFGLVFLVQDCGTPPKLTVGNLEIIVDHYTEAYSQMRPITVQRILTEAHLAIVVGVAAGCLLIILVLICVVCSVTHKQTKKTSKEPIAPNDTNYDIFNANIKYNPCNVENRMEDRENPCNLSENHSQLRESLILGEIPENNESIVLANLSRDMSLASSGNNDKKPSRLYCSDAEVDPPFNHNINGMLNNRILNEDMDKFRSLNNYREGMYNSSEYDNSKTIPAPTSPDWLMKALDQRKQSFSRWLNCEGTNLHSSPHHYNIHEYSTIPSSNRLNSQTKFNDDGLLVSQMMDKNSNPMDMLPDPPYPQVIKNNMPVKSSPTYVGLYSRPFANTDGMVPDDDLTLNPMQSYSMFQNLVPKTNAIL